MGIVSVFKDEEVNSMLADTLVLKYDVELEEEVGRRLWDEKLETARILKNDGVPIESIAKATKLPMYEIERL